MPSFSYSAVDRSGSRTSGTMDAPDRAAAARQLARKGLTPVSVRETGGATESGKRKARPAKAAPQKKVSKPARQTARAPKGSKAVRARSSAPTTDRPAKVSSKSFRRFLSLALRLHEGGYSIGDTVKVLRSRLSLPADQIFAEAVWSEIAEGHGFADALVTAGAPVPSSLLQMVRAGEATGNLAPVLRDLLDYLENIDAVRKEVIGSIVYPAFLIMMTLGVGGFLVTYMLPKIQGMVGSMGGEVSGLNAFLSGATKVLVTGFPVALLLGIAGIVLFAAARQSEAGKAFTDRFVLLVPAVGRIARLLDLYRLTGLLTSLLRNGVPTAQALVLTEPAIRNSVLRQGFANTREAVFEGAPVARTLAREGLLRSLEGDILEASEAGGQLEIGFSDLAKGYRDDLTRSTKILVNVIAGSALGTAFLLVALVALTMLTSIFEVSKSLQF